MREVNEETQDSPAPPEKIGFKRRSVAVMSGSEGEESEETRGTRPWTQLSPSSKTFSTVVSSKRSASKIHIIILKYIIVVLKVGH